jgi:hypothetical protein
MQNIKQPNVIWVRETKDDDGVLPGLKAEVDDSAHFGLHTLMTTTVDEKGRDYDWVVFFDGNVKAYGKARSEGGAKIKCVEELNRLRREALKQAKEEQARKDAEAEKEQVEAKLEQERQDAQKAIEEMASQLEAAGAEPEGNTEPEQDQGEDEAPETEEEPAQA